MQMAPGLRHLLSKSKLAFVSPRGELLTTSDDERSISDILGCSGLLMEEKLQISS